MSDKVGHPGNNRGHPLAGPCQASKRFHGGISRRFSKQQGTDHGFPGYLNRSGKHGEALRQAQESLRSPLFFCQQLVFFATLRQ